MPTTAVRHARIGRSRKGSRTATPDADPPTSAFAGAFSWSTQHFILNDKMECFVMVQGKRRGFTAAEKSELWDRWQRGASLLAIGRAFGKPSSLIHFHISPRGGIRPALRRCSWLALTLCERETISRGIATHQSVRSMARLLGRSPSTVSREINRNGGSDRYRATLAEKRAWVCGYRAKSCKLATHRWLRRIVARKLRSHWLPEQIAG